MTHTANLQMRACCLEMIKVSDKAMANKLKAYQKDHLPGGQYYVPDSKKSDVLSLLQPHNDTSESIK